MSEQESSELKTFFWLLRDEENPAYWGQLALIASQVQLCVEGYRMMKSAVLTFNLPSARHSTCSTLIVSHQSATRHH